MDRGVIRPTRRRCGVFAGQCVTARAVARRRLNTPMSPRTAKLIEVTLRSLSVLAECRSALASVSAGLTVGTADDSTVSSSNRQ